MSDGKDVNFDSRAERFLKNIHGTTRGTIRTAILQRDLQNHLPELENRPLTILDAGGGAGHMALWLARKHPGHRVVLCDLSEKLTHMARVQIEAEGLSERIEVIHAGIQAVADCGERQFDLITCHAVLEWIAEQQNAINALASLLKPKGRLSLMYFNSHAQTFRALINGNFRQVREGTTSTQETLRPAYPCQPMKVERWLKVAALSTLCHSGVRTFYDSMPERVRQRTGEAKIVEMELEMSQKRPYLDLARYIHILVERAENG